MALLKLTKNELRSQELHLGQLSRYLPTLKLKKALLQLEVQEARLELEEQQRAFAEISKKVGDYTGLFKERTSVDVEAAGKVLSVKKVYENIAGVEIPHFEGISFQDVQYALFDTPPWVDSAIAMLRAFAEAKAREEIAEEKKHALEEELRQVSIRVNLFEKVLIPRAMGNIKKIKVFLGDQQLNAVARAKVAKSKILARQSAI